jgi:hypothetical protein
VGLVLALVASTLALVATTASPVVQFFQSTKVEI